MTKVLDKFVQDIKANVPGFIAVSVTEVKSGVSYIASSADPNFTLTWILLTILKL